MLSDSSPLRNAKCVEVLDKRKHTQPEKNGQPSKKSKKDPEKDKEKDKEKKRAKKDKETHESEEE